MPDMTFTKRERSLLGKAARALTKGTDPFSPAWLEENAVTSDECYDLAINIARAIRSVLVVELAGDFSHGGKGA